MLLFVGLGNPGREHEQDRHNAGFWLVTQLATAHGASLRPDARHHGLTARISLPGGDLWLILPQTYMNLSGKAVGSLARFYKIPPEDVLAVHDELDLQPGVARFKFGGGVAGHNGLKDISAALGGPGFWRLRLGIGHPGERDRVADYVLSKPTLEQRKAIDLAIEKGLETFPLIASGQMEAAMLKLHTKST